MKKTMAVDVDRKTGMGLFFQRGWSQNNYYFNDIPGMIYWTDTGEDVIMRSTQDGDVVENIIVDGLDTADGIVVDSTGRKVRNRKSYTNIVTNNIFRIASKTLLLS